MNSVGDAREAARNAQCMNNLKQLNLALKCYEVTYGQLPPAYTTDKSGKPLHSWRVLILPYLEQKALYDQIHLDEPWDSPHNKTLSSAMPSIFRCPSDQKTPGSSETNYLLVTGPGTVFEGGKAPKESDFTRGMFDTVLMVEASGQGVNWMMPKDLDVRSLDSLKSAHARGINAAMADGSVQRLGVDFDNAVEEIRKRATGR